MPEMKSGRQLSSFNKGNIEERPFVEKKLHPGRVAPGF